MAEIRMRSKIGAGGATPPPASSTDAALPPFSARNAAAAGRAPTSVLKPFTGDLDALVKRRLVRIWRDV